MTHDGGLRNDRAVLDSWYTDRIAWKAQQPATAFLAEPLPIEATTHAGVHTATTDGTRILVNPAWSAGLDETTRQFVQAHLIWHCAAGHFSLSGVEDERRWHLACDHQINTQLLLQGFALPPSAVLFPALIGKSLSQVHAALADNPLIDHEVSADAPPWRMNPAFAAGAAEPTPLQQRWRRHSFRLVRAHLGKPGLPTSVASWLIGQWTL